jgi:hypothetical protein
VRLVRRPGFTETVAPMSCSSRRSLRIHLLVLRRRLGARITTLRQLWRRVQGGRRRKESRLYSERSAMVQI